MVIILHVQQLDVCYNKNVPINPFEPTDKSSFHANLNKLRAAVLGANDGIVSTASVVMGVAGATTNKTAIVTAGLAALVAGALSMGVGEYVSVSSQRDAEKSNPTHAHAELTSATQAAVASLVSFTVGGLIPFLAILIAPNNTRLALTVAAVVVGLIITGYFSAYVGGASRVRAVSRVLVGGLLAMAVTYFVGALFGSSFK
jgi:VIT1/CCC1 family predicted Fe2+/Mn2+ transporter